MTEDAHPRHLALSSLGDVTGISIEVGFQSLGTFSRTFRDIVGVSLTEYREREQAAPRAAIRAGVPGCFAAKWDRPR